MNAGVVKVAGRYSLLGKIEGAEKGLSLGAEKPRGGPGKCGYIFLEFLRGFESFDLDEPCVTVFGSARFREDHRYYQQARK